MFLVSLLTLKISRHERTRLLVYEWDCGQKLGTAKKQGALGLPVADRKPRELSMQLATTHVQKMTESPCC